MRTDIIILKQTCLYSVVISNAFTKSMQWPKLNLSPFMKSLPWNGALLRRCYCEILMMPYGCSCGMFGSALVALAMLSAPKLIPHLQSELKSSPEQDQGPPPAISWLDKILLILQYPPIHKFISLCLFLFGLFTAFCDVIQRKLLEKRLLKIKQYLSGSLERLCALDTKREQLEATLKLVQNATAEYNLLLYLLQRHRGVVVAH